MQAKNASEILDDATLVCWYSFDISSQNDSGPLRLIGTVVNISFVNGRVNQAIKFDSNSSYYQVGEKKFFFDLFQWFVQIYGFVLLGISNYAYSIALWINPLIINGSTLVHRSTTIDGKDWCLDLIGLSPIGQIILTVSNDSLGELVGPIVSANVWTHIVYTYSTINGLQLYINGSLNGSTVPMAYLASDEVNILTLGNPLQANAGNVQSILSNVFNGSIDEFRVYSRELNITDVYKLANP